MDEIAGTLRDKCIYLLQRMVEEFECKIFFSGECLTFPTKQNLDLKTNFAIYQVKPYHARGTYFTPQSINKSQQ